jgi:hypothetical protein
MLIYNQLLIKVLGGDFTKLSDIFYVFWNPVSKPLLAGLKCGHPPAYEDRWRSKNGADSFALPRFG